jgi:hypothetical protein
MCDNGCTHEHSKDTAESVVQRQCGWCGKSAHEMCARCRDTYYCCRDHQKQHWPHHKRTCVPYKPFEVRLRDHVMAAHKKIEGNLMTVVAHNTGPGAVFVELTETAEDFLKPSLHIAHLRYVAADNIRDHAKNTYRITLTDLPSFDDDITAFYVLIDTQHWICTKSIAPLTFAGVRDKCSAPGDDPSIAFSL